jgi:hypothetical protein
VEMARIQDFATITPAFLEALNSPKTLTNNLPLVHILYVKDNINVSRRDDLDFDDLEGIWVQIKIIGKKILFGIFLQCISTY